MTTPTPRIPLNEPQPVVRRDLYDVLVERLDTEAENWPPYPMEISPGFPPVPTAMLPATIAEQIIEDWLQKTYLPAIEREAQAIPPVERCHCGHLNASCDRPDRSLESSTAEPDHSAGKCSCRGAALPVKEGEPSE